ncbi:MAG: hypothetical protein E6Z74_10040 [Clostridium perfringens]|uniref:Uncharacterized protein n=1 Tax=Clostridium butyricum E4 str. BoNT E BL5262 TaxID=632245 RepID=C4ILG6_CLOBU|nr:hypothetical protein [Clostridium butyricum]EDT77094.1 hypothetical protein CBY_1189 [Clostridium butyricum 5521]EEP54274.1 hypothetical protein CLP_1600 [Clostridium butyricum E4 str. BoNT E BL5262]MDU5720829.1 hypothetical protein [Clostridium butyricum]MDU5776253.1 hypothetical protein [Clostridium perfringens]
MGENNKCTSCEETKKKLILKKYKDILKFIDEEELVNMYIREKKTRANI